MAHPVVSVIIVTWNVAHLIEQCLASLRAGTTLPWECLVVDSGSSDGTAARVRTVAPWAELIALGTNVGFVRGNNLALRRARGEFILLLNPDTVVHPGAVDAMVGVMERLPQVGILGPRLLNADGSLQYSAFEFPSVRTVAWEYFLRDQRRPQDARAGRYSRDDYEMEHAVDAVLGACLLIRRATLEAIGPLDRRYVMYCEELDWCTSARRQGWEVWYTPATTVTHLSGQSSQQAWERAFLELQRSRFKLYSKWLPAHRRLVLESLTRLGLLFQAGFWMKQGARGHSPAAEWQRCLRIVLRAAVTRPSGLAW
ncbi:MAG: glycosyltransferase family 2 protein [Chloroflexi bacterium]|nr:glycosyltransferase family 2 protein [Chloroflexota bacterium]